MEQFDYTRINLCLSQTILYVLLTLSIFSLTKKLDDVFLLRNLQPIILSLLSTLKYLNILFTYKNVESKNLTR